MMLYWYPYEGPLMPIYGTVFRDLMAKGHKVTIVTSFPHYRKGRPETWEEFRGRLFEKTTWHGARVIRCYVFAPVFLCAKLALFYRALNFISFSVFGAIGAIFMTGKQDLLLAPSSPPVTNGMCACFVAYLKRIPLIYNVHDIYPDMAIKLGILRNRFAINLARLAEDFVYRKAERLMVISESMRRNLISKKAREEKISVVPILVDTDVLRPLAKRNRFSLRFGLTDKFVVMYAGNIGLPHGLESVIQAAERLRDHEDILFLFVSRGEHKEEIIRLSRSKGLENVVFLPQQPECLVSDIWASADVSLVCYRRGLSTDSMPSKILAIMASGRPVLAMVDRDSDVWELVTRARCGLCLPPENPRLLSQALLRLRREEGKRKRMGERGRRFVVENLSRDAVGGRYEELFENTLRSVRRGQ